MSLKTLTHLSLVSALSMSGLAHAQSAEMAREAAQIDTSRATSLTGWEGCMINVFDAASQEVRSEILSLQSQADRAMCLRDGVAFATELTGQVQISIVAPSQDGEISVTDQVLAAEDIVQFSWLTSSQTNALIDIGVQRFDLIGWTLTTEGEGCLLYTSPSPRDS